MNNIIDKAKTAAISASLNQALKYMDKDPDTNIPKIMDMVDRVTRMAGMKNRDQPSAVLSKRKITGMI